MEATDLILGQRLYKKAEISFQRSLALFSTVIFIHPAKHFGMAPSAIIDEVSAAVVGKMSEKTTEKDTSMTPLRALSHGDELPGMPPLFYRKSLDAC